MKSATSAQRGVNKEQSERSCGQIIGWQGIVITTPAEWSLVGFGGEEKAGSLRLDSGEPEGRLRSLELRWAQSKGRQSIKDLEARVAPLLKKAARSAKKGAKSEIETRPIEDRRHADRDAVLGFSWRTGDLAAYGRIWRCATCGRVVIAQLYGSPDGRGRSAASEILAGIECHSQETGWRTWGLYGLFTQVPADYTLAGQQLMNVYLQLSFSLGQSTDLLTIEQWNLANVQLKGMYLDEWFEHKCAGLVRSAKVTKSELTAQDHPALFVVGRRSGMGYWLSEGVKQLARLKWPAVHYAALLWECPGTNRAYLIQAFSRRPKRALLEEIATRTVCHMS